MRSFKYITHTEGLCHLVAREWCMKQNYYADAWILAGQPESWDFDGVPPYAPTDAFYEAMAALQVGTPTMKRCQELLNWEPRAR